MSITKLSLVTFCSVLSLASSVQADMKWIETMRHACPTVCQNTIFPFAVPAGINPKATKARGSESVYYVCAANIGFAGWRVGHNIDYQHNRCYTGFRKSEHYGESYYCLCSNKEIPPIGK